MFTVQKIITILLFSPAFRGTWLKLMKSCRKILLKVSASYNFQSVRYLNENVALRVPACLISSLKRITQHPAENYTLLSRVRNKPYDVFGCWLNETHLISGNLHWIGNTTSCSVLWLNKAFQVRRRACQSHGKSLPVCVVSWDYRILEQYYFVFFLTIFFSSFFIGC